MSMRHTHPLSMSPKLCGNACFSAISRSYDVNLNNNVFFLPFCILYLNEQILRLIQFAVPDFHGTIERAHIFRGNAKHWIPPMITPIDTRYLSIVIQPAKEQRQTLGNDACLTMTENINRHDRLWLQCTYIHECDERLLYLASC